jgi:predicted HAD superfamily phosphohydrolase YqeG
MATGCVKTLPPAATPARREGTTIVPRPPVPQQEHTEQEHAENAARHPVTARQAPSLPPLTTLRCCLIDYGGTLTSIDGPIDPALRMRPVTREAAAALHMLRYDLGLQLVLRSNTRPAGVDHVFTAILQSHAEQIAKPDPRSDRRALAAGGCQDEPGRAIMVGNSLVKDVQAPAALGMGTVLVAPVDVPYPVTQIRAFGDLPGLLSGT